MLKKEEPAFPLLKIVFCSFGGIVLYFLMVIIFSALILKLSGNQSLYLVYGLGAGAVSDLICGFVSAKIIKEKGLFYGFISGIIQAVICTLILFVINKASAGNSLFVLFGIITAFSSVGGIAGVNLKKKIKY